MTTDLPPSPYRSPSPAPGAGPAHEGPANRGVTIVIPTFNEAANIPELLRRISAAVPAGQGTSVLFVDDSTDGTPQVIEAEAARVALPVAVHHRAEPVGGLGGAVMEGMARGGARWYVVMDADLQHPPGLLPELTAAGEAAGAGLVVASRYAAGGSRAGLSSGYRRLVSGTSTRLTRALFPRILRQVSDPMSGFFAIRGDVVDRVAIEGTARPLGYKILLELIVRCRPETVTEVTYDFGERHAGESKSGLREGWRFLRHLARLRAAGPWGRALAFGAIGVTGALPNLAVLWALTRYTGLHYTLAEVVANQFGLLWNFLLVERLLYRGRRALGPRTRFLGFMAVANADLVARIPLMVLLVSAMGLTPLPGTAVALVLAFALRFLCVERLLYR